VIPGKRGWFDVGVYYGTVHYWFGGGHLYDYVRPGSEYGFTYPPFAALCMIPMMRRQPDHLGAPPGVADPRADRARRRRPATPAADRDGHVRGAVQQCGVAVVRRLHAT